MGSYFGLKPIVTRGINGGISTKVIEEYATEQYASLAGDTPLSSIETNVIDNTVNADTTIRMNVASASFDYNRRIFTTNGTDQFIQMGNQDIYNYYGGGNKTMTFWFKPKSNDNIIIDKGNIFSLYLTGNNNLVTGLTGNNFINYIKKMEIHKDDLYVTARISNNHISLVKLNKNTLQPTDYRFDRQTGPTYFSIYNTGLCYDKYTDEMWVSMLYNIGKYSNINNWENEKCFVWKNFTYSTSTNDPSLYASWIDDISVDDEYVYIVQRNNRYVSKFRKDDKSFVTSSILLSANPYTVTVDNYNSESIYWTYSNGVTSKIVKANKSTLSIIMETGSYGAGNHSFRNPFDIDVDETHIYVCDMSNNLIKKYDKDTFEFVDSVYAQSPYTSVISGSNLYVGGYYGKFYTFNKNTLEQTNYIDIGNDYIYDNYSYGAKGVAFYPPNNLYNLDRGGYVNWFKEDGNNFIKMGKGGLTTGFAGDGYDFVVSGSADDTGSDSYLFATLTTAHHVAKYSMSMSPNFTLTHITSSGTPSTVGSDDYSYTSPEGICYDDNYVYVCDRGNNRLKKLNKSDLSLVAITGSISYPCGITASGSYLYAISRGTNAIKKMDKDFNFIEEYYVLSPYRVIYDEYTDRFYIKRNSGRTYEIRDNQMNLITNRTLNYAMGRVGNMDWASNWGMAVSSNKVYANLTFEPFFALDKENLYWENFIDAFSYSNNLGSISLNRWHSLSIVFTSNSYKLYLDGKYIMEQSVPTTFKIITEKPFTVGMFDKHLVYPAEYSQTEFGSIMIYDAELTDSEIKQNYDSYKLIYRR